MVSGLGIRYTTHGTAHPLLGARLIDRDLPTETGAVRPSTLFRTGDFVPLTTALAHINPAKSWSPKLTPQLVTDLPWSSVEAVLYRPDGYSCWLAETATPPR